MYSSKAFSPDKAIEIVNISSDEELETELSASETEHLPKRKKANWKKPLNIMSAPRPQVHVSRL